MYIIQENFTPVQLLILVKLLPWITCTCTAGESRLKQVLHTYQKTSTIWIQGMPVPSMRSPHPWHFGWTKNLAWYPHTKGPALHWSSCFPQLGLWQGGHGEIYLSCHTSLFESLSVWHTLRHLLSLKYDLLQPSQLLEPRQQHQGKNLDAFLTHAKFKAWRMPPSNFTELRLKELLMLCDHCFLFFQWGGCVTFNVIQCG